MSRKRHKTAQKEDYTVHLAYFTHRQVQSQLRATKPLDNGLTFATYLRGKPDMTTRTWTTVILRNNNETG